MLALLLMPAEIALILLGFSYFPWWQWLGVLLFSFIFIGPFVHRLTGVLIYFISPIIHFGAIVGTLVIAYQHFS